MIAAREAYHPWAPGADPFWASFQQVSVQNEALWRSVPATSSLDFYRSPALLAGIAPTSQLRFATASDGTLLLAARGFLGTDVDSFSLLEPQGDFGLAAQRQVLGALSTTCEPVPFTGVSASFLARHPTFVSRFELREARELAEYVYRLDDLASLEGHKHQHRRRAAARIEASYQPRLLPIDRTNLHWCESTWRRWLSMKGDGPSCDADVARSLVEESTALELALRRYQELRLFGWLVLVDDRPVAMSICEHLSEGVVGWRFTKTLREPRDLQCFMEREMARLLVARGYAYWNWDIDAGVRGLRERKLRARPHEVRRAFVLRPR